MLMMAFGITAITNAGTPLGGTYTIGGTSPDYMTINDAIGALHNDGVGAAVIFNIRDGIYDEKFIISKIDGASKTNDITFQSESGSSANVTIQSKQDAYHPFWLLDTASYLTFQDLTFRNDSTAAYDMFAMDGIARDVSFFDCHFESAAGKSQWALYLAPDTGWNIAVEGCSFDTMETPIYIYGYDDSVYGVSVKNNTITYSDDNPIELETVVDGEVFNNVITGYFDEPIYFYECRNLLIKGNSGTYAGDEFIYVEDCQHVVVDSNSVDSAEGDAFYFDESDYVSATNNYVGYTNYSAFYFDYVDTGDVLIANNTVDGYVDDYGIYVDADYSEVTIRNNTFNGYIDEYGIYIEEADVVIIEDTLLTLQIMRPFT